MRSLVYCEWDLIFPAFSYAGVHFALCLVLPVSPTWFNRNTRLLLNSVAGQTIFSIKLEVLQPSHSISSLKIIPLWRVTQVILIFPLLIFIKLWTSLLITISFNTISFEVPVCYFKITHFYENVPIWWNNLRIRI